MKVGILSLGCPRNTVDSEKLLYIYRKRRLKITPPEKADILIINTCGFIKAAKAESLEAIQDALELKKKGRLSKVIVAGCLVQRYYKVLSNELKDIDALIGVIDSNNPHHILTTPGHLSYIKISEGCSNLCSYCAIPLIRGRLRSKPVDSILEEVRFLNRAGIKELNITAQDITAWGKDKYNKKDIVWLLKKIIKQAKNIKWIRLLYTNPRFITKDLIDLIANEPKICNYIDVPVQHINKRILKLMNRKTTPAQIKKTLDLLIKKIPDAALRTSIIAGFPTETEKEFKELLNFIKEYKFRNLGAFIYSKEEDTPAFKLHQLPEKTKQARLDAIMKTQQKISLNLNKKLVGKEFDVIIDRTGQKHSTGRAYFQAYDIDSEIIINKRLKPGKFYKVIITDAFEYDLTGKTV